MANEGKDDATDFTEPKGQPEMEGYLFKRGAINRAFKKRYFRHKGKSLLYLTAPDAKKPQGEVDLTCVITVTIEASHDCPAGVPQKALILTTSKRKWIFAAQNEDELQAWYKELSRAAADYSPVAANNIKNVLAAREEKELRTASTEATLNTLSMTETTVSGLPLTLKPQGIAFGESRQIQIEVLTETTITLQNDSRDKISFRFYAQSDRTRYKISIVPNQGTLAKGGRIEILCGIIPLCTARVRDKVSVIMWRGGLKAASSPSTRVYHARVDMSYESLLSTKLDALELKLFDPIGEGGYGIVWRGQYRGLDVAVKSLKIEDDVCDVLDDFHREVSFMELLRHPNIVNYIGSLMTSTKLSIVTEFCPHGNLCTAFKNNDLPISFKIRCLQDTVRGMDFLHQSNIIHRDLKPQNILVVSLEPGSATVAKISDFGTVRDFVAERGVKRITLRRQAEVQGSNIHDSMTRGVGTTAYMAPEVLNASKYEKPADVYSFSMIIYFLCTGMEPYSDVEEMVAWQFTKRVADGSRPNIPRDCAQKGYGNLLDIMIKCWNQNPAARPTFNELNIVFQKMPIPVAPVAPSDPPTSEAVSESESVSDYDGSSSDGSSVVSGEKRSGLSSPTSLASPRLNFATPRVVPVMVPESKAAAKFSTIGTKGDCLEPAAMKGGDAGRARPTASRATAKAAYGHAATCRPMMRSSSYDDDDL